MESVVEAAEVLLQFVDSAMDRLACLPVNPTPDYTTLPCYSGE
jgi:hypothetical protein